MEFLVECPICKSKNLTEFLESKDYFLTQEVFSITQCTDCKFLFTNPRPEEKEISNYYESTAYISHDLTKKTVITIIYSWIRKYSIKQKIKLLDDLPQAKRILDIGCGTGEFLASCKKHGWEVIGIEPNTKARNYSSVTHNFIVNDDIEKLKNEKNVFDVITLWHVLEHIHKLDEQIISIHQLLKPGGLLIIAVPNINSWDALHYQKFWAALDLPRHLYHFSTQTMNRLSQKHNFNIEKTAPMKFDAFYISMVSEKYQKGKPNYFRALFNGIRSNFYAQRKKGEYSSIIYMLRDKKPKIMPVD